ncbi:hypothetical protein ABH19_03855 [Leptospirillum sp. Group II 'CF-1']|nr:hypothetical protein ABH19_03855 [Leptospirillum sp. Group II 'CF-1']
MTIYVSCHCWRKGLGRLRPPPASKEGKKGAGGGVLSGRSFIIAGSSGDSEDDGRFFPFPRDDRIVRWASLA